jgi:hypothetical protein
MRSEVTEVTLWEHGGGTCLAFVEPGPILSLAADHCT